jgi:hypothetical protein
MRMRLVVGKSKTFTTKDTKVHEGGASLRCDLVVLGSVECGATELLCGAIYFVVLPRC